MRIDLAQGVVDLILDRTQVHAPSRRRVRLKVQISHLPEVGQRWNGLPLYVALKHPCAMWVHACAATQRKSANAPTPLASVRRASAHAKASHVQRQRRHDQHRGMPVHL
ncbi:hypothetical protein AB4Y43_33705 [Paraburkholderia sp. BR10872]|uniref:hypothetical protein n=1 Tax=Paraburkholderia sp. BR10872 TaxID=3236989 RepID=UPI0034D23D80